MNEVVSTENVICKYCTNEVMDEYTAICEGCFEGALDDQLNDEIYRYCKN